MTVKSILSIDVDDSAFRAFKAKYDEYQKLLVRQPEAWAKVNQGIENSRSSFDKLVAGMVAQRAKADLTAKAQKEADRLTKSQARTWHDLARYSKTFATNVANATKSLLRWASVTGIVSGLLGAGGLFGIERLAQAAGGMRRSATGLGLTPGEQRAFSINFSRVVDPGQFLGGVNEALHSVTGRADLYKLGLREGDLKGKDTAQVGVEVLNRLKSLADRTPDAMLAQVLQAYGGDRFVTLQDFQRLKQMSPGELRQYEQQYAKDRRSLAFPPGVLKQWQDLQTQLSRAGEQIETVLITGLVNLAPEITRLSGAFVDVVRAFADSPEVKRWIDAAAGGLHEFADYIRTPEFHDRVNGFIHGIGRLASEVEAVAKRLGWLVSGDHPIEKGVSVGAGGFLGWLFGGPVGGALGAGVGYGYARSRHMPANLPVQPDADAQPFSWWKPWTWYHHSGGTSESPTAPNGVPPTGPLFGPRKSAFRTLEGQYNLPGGVLDAVWRQESGRGRFMTSPAGAMGHFQFMPATARQYGLTDPNDLGQSSNAAAHYLHDLMVEFHGSVSKALAAYNWGPGNLERDIREHGAAWRDYLPRETQNYLNSILPRVGGLPQRPQAPTINVQNNTGGSAIITGNQLAAR